MPISLKLLIPLLILTISGVLFGCSTKSPTITSTTGSATQQGEEKLATEPPNNPPFLLNNKMAQLEAREYPWSTLGRLNVAGRHFCNGTMVARDKILAPASCLYDLIEGRWFHPNEMVFVAGYQRDDSTIFSSADRYQIARGFDPKNKSLKSLLNNWAFITLASPLGDHTGWAGVKRGTSTQNLTQEITMEVGYRRGWEHIQVTFPFCNQATAISRTCADRNEGPLNLYTLTSQGLQLSPRNAISDRNYNSWGLSNRPQLPGKSIYVSPRPINSVQRLLVDLGYLKSNSGETTAAIKRAQKALEAQETGRADANTLYLLIRELNKLRGQRPVS